MMLLTNYDSSKTLNENKKVIFEQSTVSVDELISRFDRATLGAGTNEEGIFAVLNSIPDRNTFINFYNTLKTKKGKTFEQIINSEFEVGNHNESLRLTQLLKDKFNVTADPSVKTVNQRGREYKTFQGGFRITNWNVPATQQPDPAQLKQQQDRLNVIASILRRSDTQGIIRYPGSPLDGTTWSQYVSTYKITQDEINKAKQIVGSTPTKETPAPAAAPQKFDDVLNGRGVLRMGSKSPAVGELQQKLISLGYTNIGSPNNVFDNNTSIAVEYFQNNNNIKPDKIVGKDTATKINQALDLKARRANTTNQPVPTGTRPLPTGGNIAPPSVPGIQTR